MFPNKILQKVSKAEILQNARVGTAVHCLLFCKEIPVVPRRISQV